MAQIHIILDEEDPQNPIFVKIETPDGYSIDIGTRHVDSDGLTHLVIDEEMFTLIQSCLNDIEDVT